MYVLSGLGYAGEEVWEPVSGFQNLDEDAALDLGKSIKSVGKVAVVVPNADSPYSSGRKVFQ